MGVLKSSNGSQSQAESNQIPHSDVQGPTPSAFIL